MTLRPVIRVAPGAFLCVSFAASALGQYGGGGMGSTGSAPKGGYSSGTAVAVGAAAAAGVGIGYLALHNRGSMVGCVERSARGTKLMNEKDRNTYALIASNNVVLRPGERVALKGKRTKDSSGKPVFEVQKLVKDYGSCKQ